MRLLNALRLLISPTAPSSGAGQGAVYFDATNREPVYHDGGEWKPFAATRFPDPVVTSFSVPEGYQVMYFDQFRNDGVLTIGGTLVGMR